MKRVALALLVAFAFAARADECVGERRTVDQVIVTFSNCPTPDKAQVRWFDSEGRFQSEFTARRDQPFNLSPPFSPRAVRMSSASARGCVSGNYVVRDGRCMALYDFECAAHTYNVKIETEPKANYVVYRAVSIPDRRGVVCAQDFGGPPGRVADFADDERVVIALFGAIDRKLPLFALPSIDLAAPPAGGSATFDPATQAALIDRNTIGRGGSGASENALTIARQQKKNILKTIRVTVEDAAKKDAGQ